MEENFSILSRVKILKYLKEGRIVMSPFEPRYINTSSVDVRLGENFFREQRIWGKRIYSPYDEEEVQKVWGRAQKAEQARRIFGDLGIPIPGGIKPQDSVILLDPGETILGHTLEYIGGRDGITTMMKARSSIGRNFIEVCKCAGWGDDGYTNRWTMEITNNSRYYTIPLIVGRRFAQIVFVEIAEKAIGSYVGGGKYQKTKKQAELEASWEEADMLPKLWKDWELLEG